MVPLGTALDPAHTHAIASNNVAVGFRVPLTHSKHSTAKALLSSEPELNSNARLFSTSKSCVESSGIMKIGTPLANNYSADFTSP